MTNGNYGPEGSFTPANGQFAAWVSGEPNNFNNGQDYVHIDLYDNLWFDVFDNYAYAAVCIKEKTDQISTPASKFFLL